MSRTFVGFGFGPIQAGLFLYEAYRSGNFDRFVVAEVLPEAVDSLRNAHGAYNVNVATDSGIKVYTVKGIEVFNPKNSNDRRRLYTAVSQADEIATALPSVRFYDKGESASVLQILAEGFLIRAKKGDSKHTVIYTAENHNHAAEILFEKLTELLAEKHVEINNYVQCLNTVIGKMSGVVTDPFQIEAKHLKPVVKNSQRCFLVESFSRILISSIKWSDFHRGIALFEEKRDLIPFEEAKLYGHNAVHALIGYLSYKKGYTFISEARYDKSLWQLAQQAFIEESGGALCYRHHGKDLLFTRDGFKKYADDLLKRMTNPFLSDTVQRVVRDPRRKLLWDDRLIGTMRIAIEAGIAPHCYALAAKAALEMLAKQEEKSEYILLNDILAESPGNEHEKEVVKNLIFERR